MGPTGRFEGANKSTKCRGGIEDVRLLFELNDHISIKFSVTKKDIMRKIILLFAASVLGALLLESFSEREKRPLVIAYFSGSGTQVQAIPAEKLDQVIYSFLHLVGSKLRVENSNQDATIRALVELKQKNPDLKVLISLGGWGGCETCSAIFSDEKGRLKFAKSVAKILNIYGADGIDLDWEYPAIEGFPGHLFQKADRGNFTALVQTLRSVLGPDKIISFAAGGHDEFLENSVDWKAVMKEVDHVNVMTYDLFNGNSSSTGHHTALYSNDQQVLSTAHAVERLLSKGVRPSQIVIGGAFYGRVWKNVADTAEGLYQKGTFKESVVYKDLPQYLAEGFEVKFDSVALAAYAYNKKQQLFISFEDSITLRHKMKFVQTEDLKGIMFWELTQDNQNDLVEILYKSARNQ